MSLGFCEEYCAYLESQGIKYRSLNENVISVTYGGKNIPSVTVQIYFDKAGGNTVTLTVWDIVAFNDETRVANGLIACNLMNEKYRWIRFYMSEEKNIVADHDVIVDHSTLGQILTELHLKMVDIVDETYPEFIKARWQ